MIFSKDKKLYFVDHDGITHKGIAFLRDCYPYSECENHPLENLPNSSFKNAYDVPTEIYYLGAFLYDKFIKTNRSESDEIKNIVSKMCAFDRSDRFIDFASIKAAIDG